MSVENYYKGKKVLVTGAGRGIGKALVGKLHEYGAIVYAVSRTLENLQALRNEYPNIQILAVDLNDWDATRAGLHSLGPMDCLINNAGTLEHQNFLDIQPDMIDRVFTTNVKGVINVSQVIAQGMVKEGKGGSIVNVSSLAGKQGGSGTGMAVYSASKAALDSLTSTMALELGRHQIRVNSVNPAIVQTDMATTLLTGLVTSAVAAGHDPAELDKAYSIRYPMGKRVVSMDSLVNTILFILSDLASDIHGQSIVLDNGYLCS